MNAVIMAGGKGTRLRPLTDRAPKPLVGFFGRPVLEHQLALLRRHGITDIVLTVGHLQHLITRYFGDGRDFGVRLRYVHETRPLGTAGGVKQAAAWLGDTFIVLSGDAVTDLDLRAAVESHHANRAEVTLVLKEVDDTSQYGIAETGLSGRVMRFQEKPEPSAAFSNTANTGIYVMNRACLRNIPVHQPFDFAREVFPRLLAAGARLFGHPMNGHYWNDIGTIREYLLAHLDAISGRVSLPLVRRPSGIAASARLHPRAQVNKPAVLNARAQVDRDALIDRFAYVGEGSRIGAGASLHRCVVNRNCVIGPGSFLEDCVLSPQTVIPPNSFIRGGVLRTREGPLPAYLQTNRQGSVVALAGRDSRKGADGNDHRDRPAGPSRHYRRVAGFVGARALSAMP